MTESDEKEDQILLICDKKSVESEPISENAKLTTILYLPVCSYTNFVIVVFVFVFVFDGVVVVVVVVVVVAAAAAAG